MPEATLYTYLIYIYSWDVLPGGSMRSYVFILLSDLLSSDPPPQIATIIMTPLSYFVISLPELVVIVMICQEVHQQVQQASQLTPTRIMNKIERSSKNSSGRDWSTTQCNIRFPKDMLVWSTQVTEETYSLPTLSLNFILLIMKISQNNIHKIYCKFQSPINSHRNSNDDIHS